MRLHRFYIEEKVGEVGLPAQAGEITLADPELINQLAKVFRFHAGDQVILFDGSGAEYICEIINLNKKEVSFKIVKSNQGSAFGNSKSLALVNVSLYLSLIKKSNFELAAEKCTEIGVTEIHPIISERSEKKDLNIERLNKIVKEASEQSGRVTLPKVYDIKPLELAVSQAKAEGRECVAFHTDISTEHNPLNPLCQGEIGKSSHDKGRAGEGLCLFVGPEGGWTEKEMDLFKQNNFKILSLGQNILRAETAAIVAVWSELNK
jgi:16S rRNA (uracil1498-N3)-methyltransferase